MMIQGPLMPSGPSLPAGTPLGGESPQVNYYFPCTAHYIAVLYPLRAKHLTLFEPALEAEHLMSVPSLTHRPNLL